VQVAWNQVELAGNTLDHDNRERLFAEIHVLKTLTHRNIIKVGVGSCCCQVLSVGKIPGFGHKLSYDMMSYCVSAHVAALRVKAP